jgi:hypothetical protein
MLPSPEDTEVRGALDEALRRVFADRPVIFAGAIARAFRRWARQLRAVGLPRPLVLAAGAGGAPALPEEAEWHLLPEDHLPNAPLVERMRSLPEELAARVEQHDPRGQAIVVTHLRSGVQQVQGRPICAPEPSAWRAVESKEAAVTWFERAGLEQAPSVVLALDDPSLWSASAALDQGEGVVWAGDARDGPGGSAYLLRRVRSPAEADAAARELGRQCDRVRIMPFLEGVPCGVGALVLPDGVVVGRPMEMLVLREGRHMRHFGCASFWDPPPHDREGMRAAARRVGQALRAHLSYQGAFTLDGIMSARGFLPTEVNTRTGEGLSVLSTLDETLPLELWSQLLAAGHAGGVRAEALERVLLGVIDQRRVGWGRLTVEQPWQGDTPHPVVWEGQRYRLAAEGEVAHAVLWAHAKQPGGFLRFVFEPEHTPIGPSVAPRVVAGLALAESLLGLSLGALEPAQDLGRTR